MTSAGRLVSQDHVTAGYRSVLWDWGMLAGGQQPPACQYDAGDQRQADEAAERGTVADHNGDEREDGRPTVAEVCMAELREHGTITPAWSSSFRVTARQGNEGLGFPRPALQ
jgi:hypothetical protein